ncbi:hypothetical protein PIB30_063197 [Stylosanthes scabra]|uniref:DUF4283 domain-containing protein n=1 Tax=Stylosanthes scabra TaxID=79078 RepID=A0ABU6UK66_9FABA|nr:hypothetical protein [Stylosanthes scabra]
MGSMKIAITFNSRQSLEDAWNSNAMQKHFLELRFWTKGEVNRMKRTRMEVIGLTIHGWSEENMLQIDKVWGRVIKLENIDGRHYDSFRMLVETNTGPLVQAYVDVVIDYDTFRVFVRELGMATLHVQNPKPPPAEKAPTELTMGAKIVDVRGEGVGGPMDAACDAVGENGEMELKESWVEETQQTRRNKEDEVSSRVDATQPLMIGSGNTSDPVNKTLGSTLVLANLGPIANCNGNHADEGPTRTISIEDDRRTEDLIKEIESGPQNKNILVASNPLPDGKTSPTVNNLEGSKSDLSAPPGFPKRNCDDDQGRVEENGEERGRSRRKGRRPKSRNRNACSLAQGMKLKDSVDWDKEDNSEEEIEDFDDEATNTWLSGLKVGLVANDEHVPAGYLKVKLAETSTQNKDNKVLRAQVNRRGTRHNPGDSISYSQ